MSLLIVVLLIPFFSSLLFGLLSLTKEQKINSKPIAFIISLIPLFLLLFRKDELLGSSSRTALFPPLEIEFSLTIDVLAYLFLLVTALIIPYAIFSAQKKATPLFGGIFFLEFLVFGFFMANDLALFTFFWEATLLPLYFIIAMDGGKNRKKAALQFIIYQVAGSCLLIAGVLALYFKAGTFDLSLLKGKGDGLSGFVFAFFALAFAVKTPLFPFHGWLKNAYRESSTAGTILLAALLSKLGIYGFFRVGMGLFPEQLMGWSPYLLPFAIVGALYGAIAAYMERDYKTLFVYSSLSHVNFILVGIFLYSEIGHLGSLLQVFNHAITITGLFLVASFLKERIGNYQLHQPRGLAASLPILYRVTFIFVLASLALPSTNNFVGELLIFLGLFQYNGYYVVLLGFTTVLSCLYLLRYMQLNFFGKEGDSEQFVDIGKKEILILIPLLVLIFLIGIYPQLFIKQLESIK